MAKRQLIPVPTLDDSKEDSFNERIDPVSRFRAQKKLKQDSNDVNNARNEQSIKKDTAGQTSSSCVVKQKAECIETSRQASHVQNKANEKPSESLKQLPKKSETSVAKVEQPTVTKSFGKTNCILVNTRQRGNPILKFIHNIPLEYSDIVPDYVLGQSTCALYLSLRYHVLNPDYIHERLKLLGRQFALRVLLVQVDVKDPHHSIKELTKICILADCTLLLAWSPEESGRYLEAYKVFENKPADLLMEKQENNPMAKLVDALTNIKSVNKTNAKTLLSTFRSFKNVTEADKEILAFCPGVGLQKASRIQETLHEPFLKAGKKS